MVLLSSLGLLFVLEMAAAVNSGEDVAITANTRPRRTNKASSRLTDRNNVAELELPSHRRAVAELVQQCTSNPTHSDSQPAQHSNTVRLEEGSTTSRVPTSPPPTPEAQEQEGPSGRKRAASSSGASSGDGEDSLEEEGGTPAQVAGNLKRRRRRCSKKTKASGMSQWDCCWCTTDRHLIADNGPIESVCEDGFFSDIEVIDPTTTRPKPSRDNKTRDVDHFFTQKSTTDVPGKTTRRCKQCL